jgi:hypothetical protein
LLNTSAIKAYLGLGPGEDPSSSGILKAGDRLTVKVLKADGGNVLVSFGRFKVPALVDFAVKGGDQIRVVVAGMQGGQVRLRLIEGQSALALSGRGMGTPTGQGAPVMDLIAGGRPGGGPGGAVPLTLPSPQDIAGLQREIMEVLLAGRSPAGNRPDPAALLSVLNRVARNIGPLPLQKGSATLAPRIESQVENYGIFFEKKLEMLISRFWKGGNVGPPWDHSEMKVLMEQDLKPNLLRLQQSLDDLKNLVSGSAWKKTGPARELLEGLLRDIEHQQSRAIHLKSLARSLQESVYSAGTGKTVETAGSDAAQVFTYQFTLPDNDSSVRLKVYYAPGKAEKSRQGNRLSLLLSMGRIGDIRTDFFLVQGNLDVTFYVCSQNVKELVQEHLSHFTPALEALFASLNVKVLVSEPKIETFETQEWVTPDDKLVDYRV